MSVTNFKGIMVFVFYVVRAKNSEPNESNTHDSKKRNKMLNFLSVSRFKPKSIRFLRFKDRFNRAETIRVVSNSTRSIIISEQKPGLISVRIVRNDNISRK